MTTEAYKKNRILRRPEVQRCTGLSKSGIYLAIQQGDFPRPINIGKRAVGWLESDINEWVLERIARRAQV